MNNYRVSAMMPQEVYFILQACAAREGVPLPTWVRSALLKAANVNETEIIADTVPRYRLTPTKRAILAILEKATAPLTTLEVQDSIQAARQTVYLVVRDLAREGMILRGENVAVHQGAGAPCKSWAISELGLKVLSDERATSQAAIDRLNAVTNKSYADITAPIRAQADKDQFQGKLHSALRYVAMARLGRALDSEADLTWLEREHARLTSLADTDVAEGKATFEAHYKAVMGRIETLGGFDAISERFNIG